MAEEEGKVRFRLEFPLSRDLANPVDSTSRNFSAYSLGDLGEAKSRKMTENCGETQFSLHFSTRQTYRPNALHLPRVTLLHLLDKLTREYDQFLHERIAIPFLPPSPDRIVARSAQLL